MALPVETRTAASPAWRLLALLLLICVVASGAVGCVPSKQDATFLRYEGTPASAQSYGDATVRLNDGTEVTGPCAVIGLNSGDLVNVERNSSGTWVVQSRPVTGSPSATGAVQGAWIPQESGTTVQLNSIAFTDPTHGWVAGFGEMVATMDGGANWKTQEGNGGNTVTFLDADHGWLGVNDGSIFATIDGGAKWDLQTGDASRVRSIVFADTMHGWALIPEMDRRIIATDDGGATWTTQMSGGGDWSLNSVAFIDTVHGWAVGDGGVIFATSDGGQKWTAQESGVTAPLNSVAFIDETHGWAVGGYGTILSTTDGGAAWTLRMNNHTASGADAAFNSVAFVDLSHGWVVGQDGTIFQTVDGGESWAVQESGTTNSLYSVRFLDHDHGWAAGDGGTILVYDAGVPTGTQ